VLRPGTGSASPDWAGPGPGPGPGPSPTSVQSQSKVEDDEIACAIYEIILVTKAHAFFRQILFKLILNYF
jgi:hypothetical protein